jgi:hypothetical protein
MFKSVCVDRRRLILLGLSALVATMTLRIAAACAADDSVDLEKLLQQAESSLKRLQAEPATWTITRYTPSANRMSVEVVRHGDDCRWIVKIQKNDNWHELYRVIARQGVWYVMDKLGRATKFRPYEATTIDPLSYGLICSSAPRMPQQCAMKDTLAITSADSSSVRLVGQFTAGPRDVLEAVLALDRNSQSTNPQAAAEIPKLEQLLATGVPLEVDRGTGLVTKFGIPGVTMTGFRWLDKIPDDVFDIVGRDWEDHTAPLQEQQPGDCVLMTCYESIIDSAKEVFGNVLVVDKNTGESRRVPCRQGCTSMGCFSTDRTKAYVVSLNFDVGLNRVVQVDLHSSENQSISEKLDEEMTIYPRISPGGTKLAVLNRAIGLPLSQTQLCIVDLPTKSVTKIGPPGDYVAPYWLPGSDGCILMKNKSADPLVRNLSICHINPQGELHNIRSAVYARVCGPAPNILFQERAGADWKICDLQGEHEQTVATGLFAYSEPAVSPDGKQAIMIKFDGASALPFVVNLQDGNAVKIPVAEGVWRFPAWY